MRLHQLEQLFDDPLFQSCTNIGLAGGEPTISSFFWELLGILTHNKHITITTNALSSKKLVDFLARSPNRKKYLVQLSLDGDEEINDKIRGVKGAFRKTSALLATLRDLDVERLISFTINRLNYHQLTNCYNFANDFGARFSARMAHHGGAYENKESQKLFEFTERELVVIDDSIKQIVLNELEKSDVSPAHLIFLSKITEYYRGKQKDLPCMALESAVLIDLYGDVFPNCPSLLRPLGNLHEESLSSIWEGSKAAKLRDHIDQLKCGGCWNDCQLVSNIALNKPYLLKEFSKLKIASLNNKSVPEKITFTDDDSQLLLNGWYHLEGDSRFRFRWTEQEFSILIPKGTVAIKMNAAAPSNFNDFPIFMDVMIDQYDTDRIVINNSEWTGHSIPLLRPTLELTPVTFRLNRYYCPQEEGGGRDTRKLGLSVHNISFQTVGTLQ